MGKTEPIENLHQLLCTSKCRKFITCECSHMNILSIPIRQQDGDGETESMAILYQPLCTPGCSGMMGNLNQ